MWAGGWLAAALVLMGAGMAITAAPATTNIMSAVPMSKAGVASAVNDTTRELGGALAYGGPAVDRQVQLDQRTRGVLRSDLAPQRPLAREPEREILQGGIVADEHHGSHRVGHAPEPLEQRRGVRAVEVRRDLHLRVPQRRAYPFERLERSPRG